METFIITSGERTTSLQSCLVSKYRGNCSCDWTECLRVHPPSPPPPSSSHLRAHLKSQLEQLEPPQKVFVRRVGESIAVGEKTRKEELQERERHRRHREFLSRFKDGNKMVRTTVNSLALGTS